MKIHVDITLIIDNTLDMISQVLDIYLDSFRTYLVTTKPNKRAILLIYFSHLIYGDNYKSSSTDK